jgi:hypothetical protein
MKSDGKEKTALILCDRCIRAVKSRGEKVYVSDLENNRHFNACMWCDAPDDELFEVEFEPFRLIDGDNEGR